MPRQKHRLSRRLSARRAINRAVHAALSRRCQNLFHRFIRLQHHIGAHTPRQLPPVRKRFHGPHTSSLRRAQRGNRHQPNRSRADHGHRFPGPDRRQTQRVHRDRQRLGKRRFPIGHTVRNRLKIAHRQIHQLAEKPGIVGIAQEPDVRAHVVVSAQAPLAVIAVERRLQRAAVAHRQSRHAQPGLHNPSRGLVAQHHRIHVRHAAHVAFAKGVQIRPANAHSLYPDLHLARAGIVDRHLRKPECMRRRQFRRSHQSLFLAIQSVFNTATRKPAPVPLPFRGRRGDRNGWETKNSTPCTSVNCSLTTDH